MIISENFRISPLAQASSVSFVTESHLAARTCECAVITHAKPRVRHAASFNLQ